MKRVVLRVSFLALMIAAVAASSAGAGEPVSNGGRVSSSPIQHVVVIFQENNSFDHLLGKLCVDEQNRCDGTTVGQISNGKMIPLAPGGDIPPAIAHSHRTMVTAINGGQMNGWDRIPECKKFTGYACLEQDDRSRIPNLSNLADQYVISDRTFQLNTPSTWGSHLELASADLDGFIGDNPETGVGQKPGSGCDSMKDAKWRDPNNPTSKPIFVPSCIPDRLGLGPYRASPVQYVPTIMDRLHSAGLKWKIYTPTFEDRGQGYGRSICPTFYECLGSNQFKNMVRWDTFVGDAQAGNLPSFSLVIPVDQDSQHNAFSLMQGDNWIASVVSAVMSNPVEWSSTAIFITYDDCGCFYDHVPPPTKALGIRLPMVIVSPYAKQGFVDHNDASFASILAFTEHIFGLPRLNKVDGAAYDYFQSFNFAQKPLPPIPLPRHLVPASSIEYMKIHPPNPNDPT